MSVTAPVEVHQIQIKGRPVGTASPPEVYRLKIDMTYYGPADGTQDSITCPACGGEMTLTQPDSETPGRLIETCPRCQLDIYRIELTPGHLSRFGLPTVTHLANAMAGQSTHSDR